jgi:hypothetical protein
MHALTALIQRAILRRVLWMLDLVEAIAAELLLDAIEPCARHNPISLLRWKFYNNR